jgi:hypothetical protein
MATPTISARLLARPDLADLIAARELDLLADALNAEGVTELAPKHITSRGVRGLLPVLDAANFLILLRQLSTASELPPEFVVVLTQMKVPAEHHFAYLDTLASAHNWLEDSDGLDIGSERTQQMMDLIAATNPTKYGAAVSILKGSARVPVVVDRLQVEAAIDQIEASAQ